MNAAEKPCLKTIIPEKSTMQKLPLFFALALMLASCAHRKTSSVPTPTEPANPPKAVNLPAESPAKSSPKAAWTLVWSDEFSAPDGSLVDASKWKMEEGGNGWGNNELEYYTSRRENAQIKNGNLVMTAIKEPFTGADGIKREYSSARLNTAGIFEQVYGRFEARIKIPFGQGIWPAFWLLGNDIGRIHWPGCGEIDIMENIGSEPSTIHGTIHGPGYSGDKAIGSAFSMTGGRFADDYHLYAVEWEPERMSFYVDDKLYATRTPADLPQTAAWVYSHPFFIILDLAVGGNWPGDPDSSSTYPQTMLVDYVRVYRRN